MIFIKAGTVILHPKSSCVRNGIEIQVGRLRCENDMAKNGQFWIFPIFSKTVHTIRTKLSAPYKGPMNAISSKSYEWVSIDSE